ncbi:MFS transporter [Roseateles saccharophilus]|uniref:GPH family glycoside/pentoside/hexuronide:cation symporter n=1 Tax=Roseateles saccharophilus TaxID=304 RepID=A0A4R3UF23_ROSSA|nr:MFS transporter [Roseateles saccharophilus]MDG0835477.1 MFS transporter [Roseateles saccharophilus]TCU86114.1 GPH family glycoside/pentoside/hexuronide:cation symporter [Roseateles saccharophilus]
MNAADLPLTRALPPLADRLPLKQKIGFGLGSVLDMWGHWLYPSLASTVFNIFLGVAPGLISTVQMIKIFIDAASDAVFGWLSDNTRTRYGRRRPFILVGGVLAGIGLPLMFAVGRGWTDMQYFSFMLVSMVIYVPVMSCFNMPWVSLGAEMTPDYHERTTVMAIRNAIQKGPELAMFFAAQFTTLAIFNQSNGKPDILRGAQTYCAILGAIMVAVSIAIFLLVRERYYEKLVARTQTHIPFADTLWRTLRCRPFRHILGMMLAYATGTAMVGTLGFYATVYFVCGGDIVQGAKWNTAMGLAGMGFGFAGIPFFTWIARRHGKRVGLAAVLSLAICAFIGDWWLYDPERPVLQLLACGFVAFTGAGFWTLYNATLGDVVDYDELQTGQRREGSFAACQSWISKVGIALGTGASGWILQFTGFDSKLDVQDPHAIFMIRILLSSIPVIGLVLALLSLLRFELTEARMAEIRNRLETTRGRV